MPLANGDGLRWSVDDVRAGFETLPGYLLFLGALLALFYQWLTVLQRALFSDDVADRAHEGVGTQGLRAIGRGAVAGLVGGLVFTVVMVQIGFLSTVASLIDRESSITGFVVHLAVADLICILYGLLFVRRSNDVGSALGWGRRLRRLLVADGTTHAAADARWRDAPVDRRGGQRRISSARRPLGVRRAAWRHLLLARGSAQPVVDHPE